MVMVPSFLGMEGGQQQHASEQQRWLRAANNILPASSDPEEHR
jgi:hypothetical protein